VTFQVNYLAAYLLTTKLVCKLASARGRVINVSSVTHRGGNICWKNPAGKQHYSPLAAYAQSKLALTMYTRSLAEASGASFTALSVHPGVLATRLLPVYAYAGRPVEEAAPILTTLASPTHAVINGGYYDGLQPARAAALVENARARRRLENLSIHLLGTVMG
jgi:NAD(P)-dependent dehydrogenase (short-subunit alcohol dehydrogenase family)